jgi:cyclohexa-1,5-dienecarbonyl-CoA hydratase
MEKIEVSYLYNHEVARVVLGNGKGNVLDHELMKELQLVLEKFRDQPALKLVTFEGSGKHFSFGASVDEHRKDRAVEMLASFHKLFYTLKELSVPTLAKISGQCLGGGMELAIMCNFLFADKTAVLCQPEIILGVFPPPASVILSEKIGLARSEEMIITGKSITAALALKYGLLNGVSEDKTSLDAEVEAFIHNHILPKSASSLRYAVKSSRIKFNEVLEKYLPELERLYTSGLMNTNDANEGIRSFLEKRLPVWKNN